MASLSEAKKKTLGGVGNAAATATSALRKGLLVCGILASLISVSTDIFAVLLYPGFSFINQYVSELFAIDAPTSGLVVPLFTLSSVFLIAFASGTWLSAGRNRALRIMALTLFGNAANGLVLWNLFPMHMRGVAPTFTDTMHNTLAVSGVIFIMLALISGAAAYRNWFRAYSIGTILVVIVPSIVAFLYGPQIGTSLSTPLAGAAERIASYACYLWVGVLAIVLLKTGGSSQTVPTVSQPDELQTVLTNG